MTTRAQKAAEVVFDAFCDHLCDTLEDSNIEHSFRTLDAGRYAEATRNVLGMFFGACAGNADESEPIFTLRAQDKSAVAALAMWCSIAEREGASAEKLDGARDVMRQMIEWQGVNAARVKVAD